MSDINDDFKSLVLSENIFKDVKYYVSGNVDEKVLELLKSGGAERMNYFADYVTHLICGIEPEENDLSDANDLYEIPAVSAKWVLMCAKLKRLLSTKPYVYSNSKLFSNLTFCFSCIGKDRDSLWALITYNGGIVQLNLNQHCTHLVTISTTSDKYVKAESQELIIVITPDWIIESYKNKSLADIKLFHPKLITWPKIVKHESTTAITGFEPEQSELDEKALEATVPVSTQALLDKLKLRMPWNQPQLVKTPDEPPPNVVAPNFTNSKTSSQDINLQQRAFTQQLALQKANQSSISSYSNPQQQLGLLPSTSQVPRNVVHHTPQNTLANQPPQQQQFQAIPFSQGNLTQTQKLNRVLEQFQQRPNLQAHLNRLNQMGQQNQFNQLQRNQLNQLNLQNQQNSQETQLRQMNQQNSHLTDIDQHLKQGNQRQQLVQAPQQFEQVQSAQQPNQLGQRNQHLEQVNQQISQGNQQLSQMVQNNQHLLQSNPQLRQINQLNQINQTQVTQADQPSQQTTVSQLQMRQNQQNIVQHPVLGNIQKSATSIQQQLNHLTQQQLINRQIIGQNQHVNQQLLKTQQLNQQVLQNQQQILQSHQNQLLQSQNQLNQQQQQQTQLTQQQQQQRQITSQQQQNQINQQQLLQSHQQQQQNQINQLQLQNQPQINQTQLVQQRHNQLEQQMAAQNQLNQRRLGGQLNQHLLQNQLSQSQLVQQQQIGQNHIVQQLTQNQLGQQQNQLNQSMNQPMQQVQQQIEQNQLTQQQMRQNQQLQVQNQIIQTPMTQTQLSQQQNQLVQSPLGQPQLQNKLIQGQFAEQQIPNQQEPFTSSSPAVNQQQYTQQNQHFTQAQPANFSQIGQGNQQLMQNQQQKQGQFVPNQQIISQQMKTQPQQQQIGNPQIVNQQQLISQKINVQQQINNPQQHILINQQQPQINQGQLQQSVQQFPQQNQPNQPNLPAQQPQQRPIGPHLWQQQQQQQQQQINIRHPNVVQQQGPRVQWPPNQQQGVRQFIQLDAQTHQQLQQMSPEQRALFVAKLQKQRQLQILQSRMQQQQQQRGGHILIRGGPVPLGLNPQQQMQLLQQHAKQGVVFQSNIQQTNVPQTNVPPQATGIQHTPGLSPIQQNVPFADQNQQLQLQRQQFRIQQLQLQREQVQKAATPALQPPAAGQQPVIRPVAQTPPVDPNATAIVDPNVQQNPLVVNPKTKTALANMLSIRLQSGGSTMADNIAEPSAAGTLRLMTAQHNAALSSNNRPQDLLSLQQRRIINRPSGELIRPPPAPSAPPTTPTQVEPSKLQFSPRNSVPLQHRPGTYYGHNPNLKLPPDLFLLGCVFVVVELERFLDESLPGWQKKIEKHGGEIEKQYCNRVTHVICETQRHGVVMQALRDFKRCVTLYWLMDVLNRKQVLPPWIALHLPTMYWDTSPASKHLICLSGYTGIERDRVKHMIKYIGAELTTYFTKHNTLLIVSKSEGLKYLRAKKWGTPIVNVQWLTDVMLGHFSALNQMEHIKYQQFGEPANFSFDPLMVPNLMHAWKMPINISQESYEKVKRSASPVVLPQKPKKLKTEHVTDENDNEENHQPTMPHRILFSMCADTTELKKIVRQLGGSLAVSHKDCTHLVMPQLMRSHKLLHCICLGTYILPESWLRDSHTANKFLDESNYSVDTKEFNSEYKCDFTQTLATRNRNKLFEGKYFFLTPSVFPSKRLLVELIQSCSGVVERTRRTLSQIEATNINSPYSYVILTHVNDLHLVADLLKNKKDKVRIVCNVELIFSAILKQTFEVEPYAVKVL